MQSSDGSYKVRLAGFEPAIFGTEIRYFIQLSYKRVFTAHLYYKIYDPVTNNFKSK
jgi:hypothetical protein